jgi:hypothetical protein
VAGWGIALGSAFFLFRSAQIRILLRYIFGERGILLGAVHGCRIALPSGREVLTAFIGSSGTADCQDGQGIKAVTTTDNANEQKIFQTACLGVLQTLREILQEIYDEVEFEQRNPHRPMQKASRQIPVSGCGTTLEGRRKGARKP